MGALEYTVAQHSATLSTDDFLARFRTKPDEIGKLCRVCPNYGTVWACPPFEFDVEPLMRRYRHVFIIASEITPVEPSLPLDRAQELLKPERMRLEKLLHDLENETGGMALAFAGKCLYCPDGECARASGEPCRHPDMARPSLEAWGIDVSATAREVFGIELLWGHGNILPPRLVLVAALFHNGTEQPHQVGN